MKQKYRFDSYNDAVPNCTFTVRATYLETGVVGIGESKSPVKAKELAIKDAEKKMEPVD